METYIGYISGWRWWELDLENPIPAPRSLYGPYLDPPGPCSDPPSSKVWSWNFENTTNSPDEKGTNGFHAYKENSIEPLMTAVIGIVALYGDVCRHTKGYRAEKARILEAWCKVEHWEQLQHQARVIGVYLFEEEENDKWVTLVNLKAQKNEELNSLLNFPTKRLRLARPSWIR